MTMISMLTMIFKKSFLTLSERASANLRTQEAAEGFKIQAATISGFHKAWELIPLSILLLLMNMITSKLLKHLNEHTQTNVKQRDLSGLNFELILFVTQKI